MRRILPQSSGLPRASMRHAFGILALVIVALSVSLGIGEAVLRPFVVCRAAGCDWNLR